MYLSASTYATSLQGYLPQGAEFADIGFPGELCSLGQEMNELF